MARIIEEKTKSFKLFFYGQPFEDGLRITLAVLLPSLLLSYFDLFEVGITISLGAASVSITDSPGPIVHRKNTMLFCLLFIFVSSVITGFARFDITILGICIILLTFFFSMFSIYGMRAAMVGNAALLVMVLTMDRALASWMVILHGLYIVGGGVWYFLISLLAYRVRPYRPAQRALGESIREVAKFLLIKSDFYDVKTDLTEDYKKLLAQQIVVTEKQDAVREFLFKTRQTVEESTPEGRRLVMAFINIVDLFEDVTATYYSYHLLRDKYNGTGILDDIQQLAKSLAQDLDKIGIALYTNTGYKAEADYNNELAIIKKKIDSFKEPTGESNLVLKKMLVNIRRIVQRINDLKLYFSETPKKATESKATTHVLFVGHQSLDPKLFWSNLNFSSSVFRHAIRVCIACLVGYIIAKSIAKGYHSYWILMTIIFMLKPSFSLTKQRNIERIIGTLSGGLIGFLLLSLQPPKYLLFFIMVMLMVATYSLQRIKYLASIVCMTPFILILFNFMGTGFEGLLRERVVDTVVGCCIAFLAGYFLFPDWESGQLKTYLHRMLEANIAYLQTMLVALEGKTVTTTDYKLARKEVYIHSSNLAAAFQRMLSEPKSTQKHQNEIQQFVVLNHTLYSNIAAVFALIQKSYRHPQIHIRTARKAYHTLLDSVDGFSKEQATEISQLPKEEIVPHELSEEEVLLKTQLDFISKLALDIKKTTKIIYS